jgi:hypothetical protein
MDALIADCAQMDRKKQETCQEPVAIFDGHAKSSAPAHAVKDWIPRILPWPDCADNQN